MMNKDVLCHIARCSTLHYPNECDNRGERGGLNSWSSAAGWSSFGGLSLSSFLAVQTTKLEVECETTIL